MLTQDRRLEIAGSEKSTTGRSNKLHPQKIEQQPWLRATRAGSSSQSSDADSPRQLAKPTQPRAPSALPSPVRRLLGLFSRIAPNTAAELARLIFLRPPRFKSPWREIWWATEAESFEVPFAENHRLKAWRWGSVGKTVVLVHGWGGRGLQMGAFAAPLVEAGFRVIAVDLPAHGHDALGSTSLPEVAKAIECVLEQAAQEPGGLHGLIAHSFGCAAGALAIAQGAPVPKRMVFLAPPSDLDHVLARFSELTGFDLTTMKLMRQGLERRFGFRWSDYHPRRLVALIDSPLLVIHDTGDEEARWTEGQRLAEAAKAGRLHLTDGLGHFRLLRDESVLAEATDFLRGSFLQGSIAPGSLVLTSGEEQRAPGISGEERSAA